MTNEPSNEREKDCDAAQTRRQFLKRTAAATATLASLQISASAAVVREDSASQGPRIRVPWYRRVVRWGQTNVTERDPERYDLAWWRSYWKRTQVQGVIINAGGIVAYYPSEVPFHKRAQFLGDRDLFGELTRAAHQDDLVVLARMDSNRAAEELYRAHPDWFAVDKDGKPYRAGELYVSCINGPYYHEHLPRILREIAQRYHPEGFTDNSWSGLGRSSICYCENCSKKFREQAGQALPREHNWTDPAYRDWVRWSYTCRLEIWDFNNHVTRLAGGEHCIWTGMNSGSISGQCQSFRDYKAICARAEIIFLDHQARSDGSGFQNNSETGKLIHGLLGWDKLIPESMAMYQAGRPTFRHSAKPESEARLWMLEGFAGGIQPWWHHVGAYQEDRRAYRTAPPVNRWHAAHEQFLLNRQPVASVGVVWSQQNTDFFGRNDPELLVEQPWRGMTLALVRARMPFLPVHADNLERDADKFSVLVLPNLAAMSDSQAESVRQFVQRGGGLVATGETSLRDDSGELRPDFAFADLFGAHLPAGREAASDAAERRQASETQHTYLRLIPEWRGRVDGPRAGDEPSAEGERHPVLKGFEETDILPFGGTLEQLHVDAGAQVLLTFVPGSPVYPPETAWMREPRTNIPGLVVQQRQGCGRVAFLPADLDRRFGRDNLPDHGNLLANLVRWAARDNLPLTVEGPGLLDCQLYWQPGHLILHIVNLTSAGTWRAPVHEFIPVGPLRISVGLPNDVKGRTATLLVHGGKASCTVKAGRATFVISSVLDHECVVVGA